MKTQVIESHPIRKYCNFCCWTDWEPYEVTRVVSPTCVEIRPIKATQTVFPQDVRIGGFSAVTVDNWHQEYTYESMPEVPSGKIHLSNKGWGKGRFHMMDEPRKFYDYNF